MPVPVMNVRVVGMRVSQRSMNMEVGVRFAAVPIEIVSMLVMDVVDMRMRMLHRPV